MNALSAPMIRVYNHSPRLLGHRWHGISREYAAPALPEILAPNAINIARKSGTPAQLSHELPVQTTVVLGAHAMSIAVDEPVHSRWNVHPTSTEPQTASALTVAVTAHVALSTEPEPTANLCSASAEA